MSDDPKPDRRVGLLFVHGMGEQKRFEHLLTSAADLAELMLQNDPGATMTTDDRTAGWKLPPGIVDPGGAVPLTMTLTGSQGERTEFACREVWWADLGARSGLFDTIKFWLWALGQWGAPIYRLLDAARTDEAGNAAITRLPRSVVGTWHEFVARVLLALVALCLLLVTLSWVLAKRVFAKLLGTAPTPTLIVQYVGDVHTFEERASPGNTNLSDPGFPRRVAIRRRMVVEMVAMAASEVDAWHVVAHSLGTVLAYNGLTEIGHTLPNYLPKNQWQALNGDFKIDTNCRLRPPSELAEMMPARPAWLQPDDVVNRQLLFAKLRGTLTYGSPLDKFATLWPRIVATATDRVDEESPFPADCRWVNYYAPHDPVADHLDYFSDLTAASAVPAVQNTRTRPGWLFGIAHILYFSGVERYDLDSVTRQKRAVAGWLAGGPANAVVAYVNPVSLYGRLLIARVPFVIVVMIAVLWACGAAMVALVGGIVKALLGASAALSFTSVDDFVYAIGALAPQLAGYLLTIVLLMGLLRWWWESHLNLKLLALAPVGQGTAKVAGVIGRQMWVGLVALITGVACTIYGVAADAGFAYSVPAGFAPLGHFSGLAGAAVAVILASLVQLSLNRPTKWMIRI